VHGTEQLGAHVRLRRKGKSTRVEERSQEGTRLRFLHEFVLVCG